MKSSDSSKNNRNLEIANELYKFAFRVKKQRFKELNPTLSPAKIDAMTKGYFRDLKTSASRPRARAK